MYLLNDNSIDKSNVCISTKGNISTLNIYIMFKTFNDIYISSLSKTIFFNIILNIVVHIHQKYIIPHNKSNFHKNAPLLFLIWQKTFFLGKSRSNYVVLVVKNMSKYWKMIIVDNHIRRYIQNFITTTPS
jgi:hypothetical protein